MTTLLHWSVEAVDAVEWGCVLCGISSLCNRAFHWGGVVRHEYAPPGQLRRSTTSLFFAGWRGNTTKVAQLWASGDWQLHHDNTPAHVSHLLQNFLAKHQITRVTQPHYSPDLVPCDFWLFPKLKSPLEGKRFQTMIRFRKIQMGQVMAIPKKKILQNVLNRRDPGRTVWGPTLKGTETSLSYVQCFLYLVSSTVRVSSFHITCLDIFWTDLIFADIQNIWL